MSCCHSLYSDTPFFLSRKIDILIRIIGSNGITMTRPTAAAHFKSIQMDEVYNNNN